MRIIQTCPKCGGDLQDIIKTSYPPKAAQICMSCGLEVTYDPEIIAENVIRVPFRHATADPCAGCPNHPRNGGSGICHCTVPFFSPNSPWKITC